MKKSKVTLKIFFLIITVGLLNTHCSKGSKPSSSKSNSNLSSDLEDSDTNENSSNNNSSSGLKSWSYNCTSGPTSGGKTNWVHSLVYNSIDNKLEVSSLSSNSNLDPDTSQNTFSMYLPELKSAQSSITGCYLNNFSSGTILSLDKTFETQIAVCLEGSKITIRHLTTIDGKTNDISDIHCEHSL